MINDLNDDLLNDYSRYLIDTKKKMIGKTDLSKVDYQSFQ